MSGQHLDRVLPQACAPPCRAGGEDPVQVVRHVLEFRVLGTLSCYEAASGSAPTCMCAGQRRVPLPSPDVCGWVGVFGAAESKEGVRQAADTLASRGPDGSGERVIAGAPLPVAMAHRRLAILDPSPAGAQPMHDAERGLSVVYNGEIYNSPELRRGLQAAGARFSSGTDTEVLLRGWAEWGDDVLGRIEGIFSFALVDERRGRVLMARDRLGVKPLYWAQYDGAVIAGSAPRAILALRPELGRDVDRTALAQYLTLLWVPHPRTPWDGVKKLPPGSALSLDGRRLRQWRYWSPPERTGEPIEAEELRDALERATARQLLSDVPVGLLLSGGLDSTLLLQLMARHYAGPELHALTAGYDPRAQRLEISPDDARYAVLAASEHPGVSLTSVVVDADPADDVDALSSHFDDPVADPAAISLYRLARSSRTKVLLSGVGGEELFAGYPRHLALGKARLAARLPVPARRTIGSLAPLLHGGKPGPLYGPRRNSQKLARAMSDRRPLHYWRLMAQLTADEVEALVPGAVDDAFDELDAQSPPLAAATLGEALRFDLDQFLPNLNLAYVDKAAMAASVEVRVPLLDEEVAAMATRADPACLVDGGRSKLPLREAARGLVPQAVIDRPKSGFGGPARWWFRGQGRSSLAERVEALGQTGLVEPSAALAVLDTAVRGRSDAALAAWALVCLQAWHDRHRQSGASEGAPVAAHLSEARPSP